MLRLDSPKPPPNDIGSRADSRIPASSVVYTPDELARAMVGTLSDGPRLRWLDPCLGAGAFVEAISARGVSTRRLQAIDISRRKSASDLLARVDRGVDFVGWSQSNPNTIDRVVMNPPYTSLNRVRGRLLRAAQATTDPFGESLPLLTNYWCAFVLSTISCLRPGGEFVAVLPAAWDYAKYAEQVRQAVMSSFQEVTVVRSQSPLFPDVRDGTVILIAKGRGKGPAIEKRIEVRGPEATIALLEEIGRGSTLKTSPQQARRRTKRKLAPLKDVLEIRIGAVTGHAKYFLLTEEERILWKLPQAALKPVLSRSAHLTGGVMDAATWRRLKEMGDRVWLFRPPPRMLSHPAVRRYLRLGRSGACNLDAFKIRSRDPWHQTPLPSGPHGFVSGMSSRLPFLVLNEMSGLTATNTLYVVHFKRPTTRIERASIAIAMLSSSARAELKNCCRVYPDGLLKLEPSELAEVRIPVATPRRDAVGTLRSASAALLAGRSREAEEIANRWIR